MGKSSKKLRKEQQSETRLQDDSGSEDMLDVKSENEHSYDEYSDDFEGKQEDTEGEEEDDDDEEEENEDGRHNVKQKDAEIEELEKELSNIRHEEQDILRNLRSNKDDDALKGQAVKNQKVLWDKTLELRFLLQKAFVNSNRLPKEPFKSSFCDSDSKVDDAYSDLISSSRKTLNSLLELQEAILEKNPSIQQETTNGNSDRTHKRMEASGSSNEEEDEEWSRVSEMHSRIALFRNRSIDKWQRKTQVTTGAAAFRGKLQAFNQNISEQVAAYMRDPTRMIKGMQQSRSTVAVFGSVPDAEDKKKQDTKMEGNPELLDDSDFYQQLLKEFFETFDTTASETAFYALKRMQTKKRKVVDRRASKSRKIRYNVHEKIVNFMAPQPMNIPPMAPKLFQNLFGLKTQKPLHA